MKSSIVSRALILGFVLCLAASLPAEVKMEEKTLAKFSGMMGSLMGTFGGKAAKEGVITTTAIKGNRSMTSSDLSGSIIDLDEQKIYELDMKKKTYEVVTFEEMRRRMKESQEKLAKSSREVDKSGKPDEKQMEVDFAVKESGEKKTISGFDCRELVVTITAHEKGKTIEQGGGTVITSHMWMTPSIPAEKEMADFHKRYAKALWGSDSPTDAANQMAAAFAMYPALKSMMGKLEVESTKMEGTNILTETAFETVASPEQAAERKQESQDSGGGITSIRGLGGMLGRKMARKKEEPTDPQKANRSTIFTSTRELLKISTSVAPADLAVPAGFKEKKN